MPSSKRTRHRQRPEDERTEPTAHRLRYRLSATTTPLTFERAGYTMHVSSRPVVVVLPEGDVPEALRAAAAAVVHVVIATNSDPTLILTMLDHLLGPRSAPGETKPVTPATADDLGPVVLVGRPAPAPAGQTENVSPGIKT